MTRTEKAQLRTIVVTVDALEAAFMQVDNTLRDNGILLDVGLMERVHKEAVAVHSLVDRMLKGEFNDGNQS